MHSRIPYTGEVVPSAIAPNRIGKLVLGPGCVRDKLSTEVDAVGGSRVLVITGNTIATKTDLLDAVKESLGTRPFAVFPGVKEHTPRSCVLEAARLARDLRADALVNVGGGSTVDCARAVAMVLAEGDDFDRLKTRFTPPHGVHIPPMPAPKMPVIAIPTTLSAAEFSPGMGISDEETGQKDIFLDPKLTPSRVFLDPTMTLHTPERLWTSTAIRALDHCVERNYARTSTPYTQAITFHALGLLFEHLQDSVQDPRDLYAREQLQIAAWFSSVYPPTGCLSHAIGHQLGSLFGVPHGYTSCVTLPTAMSFNRPASAAQQARMARAMGLRTEGMNDDAAAHAAAEAVDTFIRALKLPRTLREVGVPRDKLGLLAEAVMHDILLAENPRPIERKEQVLELLEAIW